jgi:sugar phosphate isomerase/epimerase
MTKIPVGVQLYSVRDECKQDLPGTLARIRKMGYAGVEFAGVYGYSAGDLRRLLDDLGLQCSGAHIGFDQLLGDALTKTVEFYQVVGCKYLIVPWIPDEMRNSTRAWLASVEQFNRIAERLKPYQMQVGYHNHYAEFALVSGQPGLDLFFANTESGVIMQLDIHHTLYAGADPLAYLRRFAGRAVTAHLSDYSPTNAEVLLGDGQAPWTEIFTLCESLGGTTWYIIEQEGYPIPPMDSIAACLDAMRRMGKA